MLGRHPQLYGVPELNLFVSDTIEGWYVSLTQQKKRAQPTSGLLRVIAQLHEETQTEQSIERAWEWLAARRRWSTRRLWEYLSELVYPRVLLDKSPLTAMRASYMTRAAEMIPNAQFIHLVRHPVSTTKSMQELRDRGSKLGPEGEDSSESKGSNPLLFWYKTHSNIMKFCASFPEGQCLRVMGEEILEENDLYLKQICQWLGLRDDSDAIESMKHPEYSPYACLGPVNANYGNDPKFLMSPELRPAKFKLPSVEGNPFLSQLSDDQQPKVLELSHQMGYR
jgi:hypothetical protein